MRLIIHAVNVHQGGGAVLLSALLKAIPPSLDVIAILDGRMALPGHIGNTTVNYVKPSIIRRLIAEWWLARNIRCDDVVLCFGNLPPLFKLSGRVVLLIQNRYLIEKVSLKNFSIKVKLRLAIERLWLRFRLVNVDELFVQTPSMKDLLGVFIQDNFSINMVPFVSDYIGYSRKRCTTPNEKKDFDFIYVASGELHKNHRQLIEAWCLLAEEGIFPSLRLTLNQEHFPRLHLWITQKVEQYQLNVKTIELFSRDEVMLLYSKAEALIYPSTFESLGLPLIEARQAGLSVLASELDYVRDVLDPEETFDPESAVSIARAVKRFMRVDSPPLPLTDAAGFLKNILEKVA